MNRRFLEYSCPVSPSPSSSEKLGIGALLLLAMLWGSTFFSLKALLVTMNLGDLLAVRFTISALVLVAVFHKHLRMSRSTLLQGLLLGLIYGAAQVVQTEGLARTSASVSGFITGLYVVLTPIFGLVIFRSRMPWLAWVGVALSLCGLAALSLQPSGGEAVGAGELLTLACAALYAIHIVLMGRWSNQENAMSLTIMQSVGIALVAIVYALPGGISLPSGVGQWAWVLYLSVLAGGAATLFLQTWGQARVEATKAAVIMCSEPLWAAVFAMTFGEDSLTWRLALGGVSILTAMVLVSRAEGADSRTAETAASVGETADAVSE
jgi:drug/metabolite transporter (DMT)-like permease